MGAKYGRDLHVILRKHNCTFVRDGKGDHEIWYSPITNRIVVVDFGTRSRHTANKALKEAGINHKF